MSVYDIKGRNAIFQTNVLGDYTDLVCVKSFFYSVTADTKETTTEGDGYWKDFDYDRLSYTLNLNGLTQILGDNGEPTFLDLYDALIALQEMGFRLILTDDSDNPCVINGTVIITNKTFDANPVKLLNSSASLLGKGAPNKTILSETTTLVITLGGVNLAVSNALTGVTDTYKVNDYTVLLLSNQSGSQQSSIRYQVPTLGGGSYTADYGTLFDIGISNISYVSQVSGSNYIVTAIFDFEPATSNKQMKIVAN